MKQGGAYSIMSTYGPVNGLWTAGNYDLLTTILRKEWGYQGIVMTDWWAKINEEGEPGSGRQTIPMVRAQNDVYMVVADAASNSAGTTPRKAWQTADSPEHSLRGMWQISVVSCYVPSLWNVF